MRRKIDVIVLVIVLALGIFGIFNAQKLGDIWHSFFFSPSSEVSTLADDAGMSKTGQDLFYRFSPELRSQHDLDEVCDSHKLGCTVGSTIYILEAGSDAEYNRNIVTATHEMLHVAYSRLQKNDLDALESLLKAELQKPQAGKIIEQLKQYPEHDYYNEAHSFLGTEVKALSPALEQHYKTYFSDRNKTLKAFETSPR